MPISILKNEYDIMLTSSIVGYRDFLLFGGNRKSNLSTQRQRYQSQQSKSKSKHHHHHNQHLQGGVHGTYDDHDFGANDSGAWVPNRMKRLKLFRRFLYNSNRLLLLSSRRKSSSSIIVRDENENDRNGSQESSQTQTQTQSHTQTQTQSQTRHNPHDNRYQTYQPFPQPSHNKPHQPPPLRNGSYHTVTYGTSANNNKIRIYFLDVRYSKGSYAIPSPFDGTNFPLGSLFSCLLRYASVIFGLVQNMNMIDNNNNVGTKKNIGRANFEEELNEKVKNGNNNWNNNNFHRRRKNERLLSEAQW